MRWTRKDLLIPEEKASRKTTNPKLECGKVGTAQRQAGSVGGGKVPIQWHQEWGEGGLPGGALKFEPESQEQRNCAVELLTAEWPESL